MRKSSYVTPRQGRGAILRPSACLLTYRTCHDKADFDSPVSKPNEVVVIAEPNDPKLWRSHLYITVLQSQVESPV